MAVKKKKVVSKVDVFISNHNQNRNSDRIEGRVISLFQFVKRPPTGNCIQCLNLYDLRDAITGVIFQGLVGTYRCCPGRRSGKGAVAGENVRFTPIDYR